MTEITPRQLDTLIRRAAPAELPPIWLIHGAQLLVEHSAERVTEHLLAGCSRALGSSSLEGTPENIPDLLEQVNTFALLSGNKVIVFKDARLFEARGSAATLLQQIETACRDEQFAKAGRLLSEWSSRSGENLQDLMNDAGANSAITSLRDAIGVEILNQVIQSALLQSGSSGGDHTDTFIQAIEKGFPKGHFVIITVYSKAPKNYKIYKSIEKQGVVIDCSVPAGERRTDKAAQTAVLREMWEGLLHRVSKTAAAGVFEAVTQLIGPDLATFYQSTEKLIDYSGSHSQITLSDVQRLLRRTRTDPIYDLTNAVSDRNLPQALFYFYSLQADWHPLQLITALANQMRRLLIVRDFIDSDFGRVFNAGLAYSQFQEQVLPAALAYDGLVQKRSAAWHGVVEPGKELRTDLRLAAQAQNAYPLFQAMNKAYKFKQAELVEAVEGLSRADVLLKSAGQNAALIITKTIHSICRAGRSSAP